MHEDFLRFLKDAESTGVSEMKDHIIKNFSFPTSNRCVFDLLNFLIELSRLEDRIEAVSAPGSSLPSSTSDDIVLYRNRAALYEGILLHIPVKLMSICWSNTMQFVEGLVYASRSEREDVASNEIPMTVGQILEFMDLMEEVAPLEFAKKTYARQMLKVFHCFSGVIFKYREELTNDFTTHLMSTICCSKEMAEDIDAILRQNATSEVLEVIWLRFSRIHSGFSLACGPE